jgi:hypothetical protein
VIKLVKLALSLLFVLTSSLLPLPGAASWYPPDYAMCHARDVRTSGPFELIRDVTSFNRNGVTLTAAYRGYLLDRYPAQDIHFYVRLNGQDVFVPAQQGSHGDAFVYFRAGARSCAICTDYLASEWPACAEFLKGHPGADWVCSGPTADETELFTWAFSDYSMNAWDIAVAAEAHGEWDSNFGADFQARFEPRYGCF